MQEAIEYDDTSEFEEMERLAERLQVFGARLSRLASDQAAKRTEVESRWLDDTRQYHGQYSPGELAKLREAKGSEIYTNVTRNKTNAAEARFQDMMFPTDDRSWGIEATPVPDSQLHQQIPPEQLAAAKNEIEQRVTESAELMQDQIDDQLSESRYQVKARDSIHDACMLGTGILKGPVIVGKQKKRWETMQDGVSVLHLEESRTAAVERVDPWDFYPDMSARTIDEAEFIFERRKMSKRQLRDFAKLPGVLADQVRELAKMEASETHIAKDYLNDIREITGINTVTDDKRFEVWEYHGPISKMELLDALEVSGELSEMCEEDVDALNDEVEGIVFFSGDRVLKVVINPMDTNERPYSVFNWEKDDSSIFGFGVPYLMRNPQKVMNAAWRMLMDNGGMSVADQLVINKDLVYPADQSWSMGPKKIWILKDPNRNVNEVFGAFATRSHQAELANIFTMARQLADEETNLPLVAQGEQAAHVTKTSSGMAMLMNSANIVLRRAVKNWDDDITRPLIGRFYDWNMQFTNRPEIKGDFSVDARGSGALLVREKQQENLMIYANISASNPEFMKRRDWDGLDREIAKSLEVPYYNITKTEAELEEAEAMAGQNMSPEQQMAQADMQIKQAELQIKQAEIKAMMQRAQIEAQIAEHKMAVEREIALSRLAVEREMTVAELQAKLGIESRKIDVKAQVDLQKDKTTRENAAADHVIKRATAEMQSINLANKFDTF